MEGVGDGRRFTRGRNEGGDAEESGAGTMAAAGAGTDSVASSLLFGIRPI